MTPHIDYEARSKYVGPRATDYLRGRATTIRWRSEQRAVRDVIARFMQSGESVLDVPFGTGRFAEEYLNAGLVVYGVDISSDMLDVAKQVLGSSAERVSMSIGDAIELSFPDRSVDHVVCVRLLGHLPPVYIERAVSEFERVARKTVTVHLPVIERSVGGRLGRIMRWLPYLPAAAIQLFWQRLRGARVKSARDNADALSDEVFRTVLERHGWRIKHTATRHEGPTGFRYISMPVRIYTLARTQGDTTA